MAEMTERQRGRRIKAARKELAALRANPNAPRHTFWLSFADSDRAEGDQFLGVTIVDGCVNFFDAIHQSHAAKANPGGEVQGQMIPQHVIAKNIPLRHAPRLVLMPKAELLARELIVEKTKD